MSVVEALIDLSASRCEIQLLRSFQSEDDAEGMSSVLDDFEASPTSITFLSATTIQTADFLNAGVNLIRRGICSRWLVR